MAVQPVEQHPEVRAEDVVVGVVAAEGRRTRRPVEIAPEAGPDIVGHVAVQARAALPVIAVEILAIADRGAQGESSDILQPPERSKPRRRVLPLVGIVGGIETVRPEIAVLVSGLEIEIAGPPGRIGRPYIGIVVREIGIVPVPVAAPVGGGPEHRQTAFGNGARKIRIGIAVLAARTLEAQIGRAKRCRADIHRPGVGPDSRKTVEQLHRGDAVEIHGQRVGLMPRAGIRKVNTVEKDHRLVKRTSPYGDVGLCSPASAFADIDRRREAQNRLQSRGWLRSKGFPVEKRGVRLGIARGCRGTSRDTDLPDPQVAVHGGRIGLLRRCLLSRKHQDRHPDGEDSDRYAAVATRKDRPAPAIPTPPAHRRGVRLHLDVFHGVRNSC